MISLAILTSLISVFVLYSSATKTEYLPGNLLEQVMVRLSKQSLFATGAFGFLAFLVSTLLLCSKLGNINGTIGSIVLWTLVASSLTLFGPIPKVRLIYLLILLVVSSFLEFML